MSESELCPTTPNYEARRLAEVVAEITSGVKGADPEDDDYLIASKAYEFIEAQIVKDEDTKWFIRGRLNGWIGPFDTRSSAIDFAWDHLNEACQFHEKPADFEGEP